ncbi:mycofactocin-coupled SDR family oxidoreductase [Mycolicibacterium sp. NCC-Tsukiji]|jgi:SDR family mycofactocin-dependent oxidoreductase|uniref:mycofactocin-coupled SDR family oxidoreductase n=1 Tax=Mycolicibacterium sp. NCC-Tsukiji TaxID=2185272 RepID=UPI000EC4F57A|nr:mycofactocin-coupled SDR family oxidoreductase [Mycolicibacterium sp. NCC-Tsukiji]GCB01313.1 3-ketoacyl-ACP reductase [Mycolicibacterium sp. NCC-Tsukiji]
MAGQFEGKVAFITGAARGQGRSHAVRFAEEGADIIAVDLCDQIASVGYPMSTREDLDETVNLVEKTGRRIIAETGDVRDFERLKAIVSEGVAELGRLDFVLANAGILPGFGEQRHEMAAFDDSVTVLLNGVYYTIEAALPYLLSQDEGGAIVITSSTAGLNSLCPTLTSRSRGMAGYHAGKHGVVGLMRYYATSLAEKNIRVNTVHPTGVATPMILNEGFAELVAEHPEDVTGLQAPLPVELIDPSDVSEAMVYLCGRSGRYITGITLPVDGGISVK